jgi:hypothetical protein
MWSISARNRIGATSRPHVQQASVGRVRPAASSHVGGVTDAEARWPIGSYRLCSGSRDDSRGDQHSPAGRKRLQVDHVARTVWLNRLMYHGEFEPDRRLGEARHLHAHHGTALGTSPRYGGGGLVDRKAVPLVSQTKGRPLRRIAVHTPPTGEAAVTRRQGLPCRPTSFPLTAFPLASVDDHFDPGRPGKVAPEDRIRLWPIRVGHDHPA